MRVPWHVDASDERCAKRTHTKLKAAVFYMWSSFFLYIENESHTGIQGQQKHSRTPLIPKLQGTITLPSLRSVYTSIEYYLVHICKSYAQPCHARLQRSLSFNFLSVNLRPWWGGRLGNFHRHVLTGVDVIKVTGVLVEHGGSGHCERTWIAKSKKLHALQFCCCWVLLLQNWIALTHPQRPFAS